MVGLRADGGGDRSFRFFERRGPSSTDEWRDGRPPGSGATAFSKRLAVEHAMISSLACRFGPPGGRIDELEDIPGTSDFRRSALEWGA